MKRFYALFMAVTVLFSMSAFAGGGEDCSTATVIGGVPYADAGNTTGALDDYSEVCEYPGVVGTSPDQVYSFNPAVSGFYDMTLCTGVTNYDTKMFVYAGSCPTVGSGATGTEYGCNDDACQAPLYTVGPWNSEIINLWMDAGTDYYIVIDGYDAGSEGPYTLFLNTAAAPPSGADVQAFGLMTIYPQRPVYFDAMDYAVAVVNVGATPATGVSAVCNAYYEGDGFVTPVYTNTSTSVSLAANSSDVVVATASWSPADTGLYLIEWVMTSSLTPDDTASNDTSFQLLYVTESTVAHDEAIFGAPITASLLTGATAEAEYGQIYSFSEDVTLNAVSAGTTADALTHGNAFTVTVYEYDPSISDDLGVVAVSDATTLDSNFVLQDVTFTPAVDLTAGTSYLFAFQNDNFVWAPSIVIDGTTSVVRDTLAIGCHSSGCWWFFGGLSNLMWLDIDEAATVCDPANTPHSLASAVGATSTSLTWTPTPLSVGCQIKATRITPPGPSPSQNFLGFEVGASGPVPNSIFGAGTTWDWKVRCACEISPTIIASTFSLTDQFSIPVARVADESNITVSLYPNPVDNEVYVSYEGAENGEVEIRIVNMLGQVFDSRFETVVEGLNTYSFDVSSLEDGVYFISIEQGDYSSVESFTISR